MKIITPIVRRCATTLVVMLAVPLCAWSYSFMAGNIYYNILSKKDHTLSVTYKDPRTNTQYTPSAYSGKVVIPPTVTYKGVKYTVVEIGRKAFCFGKNVTAVTIPNTVRSVRFMAFSMTGLTALNLPASVVTIEDGFLQQAKKMKTLTMPSTNPYFRVEKNVLFNKSMTSLIYCTPARRRSYTVPSKVRRLCHAAFEGCTIVKMVIPSTVNEFVGDPFLSLHFLTLDNRTKPSAKKSASCLYAFPGKYIRKNL